MKQPTKSKFCVKDEYGNRLFYSKYNQYIGTMENPCAENISELILNLEQNNDIIKMQRISKKKMLFLVQPIHETTWANNKKQTNI